MQISQLATLGLGTIGVSALSGFGATLGRDTYRNIGNIIGVAACIAAGLGAIILPYIAMVRLFSWHPATGFRYFFTVFLKWLVVFLIGCVLLYPLAFLAWVFIPSAEDQLFRSPEAQAAIRRNMAIIGALPTILGAVMGLMRRSGRKAAYRAMLFNEDFLKNRGFREYPGARFPYVDGDGNRMRIINNSNELVELEADTGQIGYLTIDRTGRFEEYAMPS